MDKEACGNDPQIVHSGDGEKLDDSSERIQNINCQTANVLTSKASSQEGARVVLLETSKNKEMNTGAITPSFSVVSMT